MGTSKGKAIIMDRKGNVKSTIDVGSRILKSSPRLLKSGNIAFGTADGSVHEVNAQGIEVAKFSPGAGIPQFITELKDGSLAVSSQPNTDGTGATLHMLQHSSTPTKTISKVTQVPCSVLQPGAAVDADAGVKKLDADKVKTPAGTGTDVPTMLPAK
ncbi:MAG: hypothetical protein HY074_06900 [Deltaproteobacteria bacterium]|nr:hypothetical protein [Deltaproteobacteria bacterium]